MGKDDPKGAGIVRGYSQGLVSLARAEGMLDRVESELEDIRQAFTSNNDLKTFLKDPKVTSDGKQKAIAELMGNAVSKLTLSHISLAIAQGRGALIPAIIDDFFILAAESRKKITAKVTTAVPLSKDSEEKIVSSLSEQVGEPVFLKKSVDPSILGGLVIHLGEQIIDGSLRGQLTRMKEGIAKKVLAEKGKSIEN